MYESVYTIIVNQFCSWADIVMLLFNDNKEVQNCSLVLIFILLKSRTVP